MAEFCMPSLGADMTEGTLFEWFVQPGGRVKRGDVIASVETAKGVIDVEVFVDGVVEALLVEPGTEAEVGAVLAMIRADGEAETAVPTPAAQPEPVAAAEATAPAVVDTAKPALPVNGQRRTRISPAARKLAQSLGVDVTGLIGTGPGGAISREDIERAAQERPCPEEAPPTRISPVARNVAEALHVDLRTVTGSGPRGAITKADVEAAAADVEAAAADVEAAAAAVQPEPAQKQPPKPEKPKMDFQTSMRLAIAKAMSRANQDIPHYYLETRIDLTPALQWLEQENLKRSIKDRILPVVLLIKGVAKALNDVPALNGYWTDDQHQPQEGIHIGFAIALRQGGLVTPAIHHADLKSLDELMAAMRDLIMRTRAGRLRSSELTDATITLTSLGDLGVEKVFGVIYPPQVALVGFGKVTEQPWAENGMLGIRQIVTATLAGDHRATDGRIGAQFLDALNKHLQKPEAL